MSVRAWVCPHCQFSQMLPEERDVAYTVKLGFDSEQVRMPQLRIFAEGCTNPACGQPSALVSLSANVLVGLGTEHKVLAHHRLLPRGAAKPQPEYIPHALREDYTEACAIRDLSPKAAATLVRRCLQGMIRNFCGIKDKKTLNQEIIALRALVDEGKAPSGVTAESVEAIDAVRGIGNIGAHMEHDIDLIVDVDPDEAQILIELVEMLFAEWYVARHARQEKLARIKAIGEQKQLERKGTPQLPAPDAGGQAE